jgi:phosphohistidine phosphatase
VWSSGCPEGEVHLDRRIYLASPQRLLEVIHEADEDADVLMVVGHAPGIPSLAELLCDGEGSVEGHRKMAEGYPTCSGCRAALRGSGGPTSSSAMPRSSVSTSAATTPDSGPAG